MTCSRALAASALGFLLLAVTQGCSPKSPATPQTNDTSQVQSTPELKELRIAQGGLRLTAPEGWAFRPNPDAVQAELHPVSSDADLPVIVVQATQAITDLGMQSLVAGFSKHIARGIDDPKITKDEKIEVGLRDAEAYQIGYTGKLEGQPVSGAQVLVKHGEWLYVFTGIAATKDAALLDEALTKLLSGLGG